MRTKLSILSNQNKHSETKALKHELKQSHKTSLTTLKQNHAHEKQTSENRALNQNENQTSEMTQCKPSRTESLPWEPTSQTRPLQSELNSQNSQTGACEWELWSKNCALRTWTQSTWMWAGTLKTNQSNEQQAGKQKNVRNLSNQITSRRKKNTR